jgi:insulysin
MSVKALEAFQRLVQDAGIPLDGISLTGELGGGTEPLVSAVVKFCSDQLAAAAGNLPLPAEKLEQLLAEIPKLADKYPAESASEGNLKEGAILIGDPNVFKQGLEVAPEPTPVVEWGDLPTSKL